MLFNPFTEQTSFFKSRITVTDFTSSLYQDFLTTCEQDPQILSMNPDTLITCGSLAYLPEGSNSITIFTDLTDTVIFSRESIIRLIEAFKLHADTTLSFDKDRGQFKLGLNWIKPGKFFKILNPLIETVALSNLAKAFVSHNKPPIVELELIKATTYYNSGTGPMSCMTQMYFDNGMPKTALWDALGVPVLCIKENGRIVARTLLYSEKYFGKVYTFDINLTSRYVKILNSNGYLSIAHAEVGEVSYSIPAEFSENMLPYLDDLSLKRNMQVITNS